MRETLLKRIESNELSSKTTTMRQLCIACKKDTLKIEQHCLQKLFNNDFFWSWFRTHKINGKITVQIINISIVDGFCHKKFFVVVSFCLCRWYIYHCSILQSLWQSYTGWWESVHHFLPRIRIAGPSHQMEQLLNNISVMISVNQRSPSTYDVACILAEESRDYFEWRCMKSRVLWTRVTHNVRACA